MISPTKAAAVRRVRRPRGGFTLIELLLVLAVLVAIAALALPAFHGPLENQRLRKSGDRMRVELAKARILAMRTGRTQAFYYTPGGNRYWVEPLEQSTDLLEMSLRERASPRVGQSAESVEIVDEFSLPEEAAELPENVSFVSGLTISDQRDAAVLAENEMLSRDDPLRVQPLAGQIAPPILFYPDGTTASARLVLGNTRNSFVLVELRGLTGVARVTDLLTADELPP